MTKDILSSRYLIMITARQALILALLNVYPPYNGPISERNTPAPDSGRRRHIHFQGAVNNRLVLRRIIAHDLG